ncbi:MAG: hypothetical protein LUF87_05580 [Alistipes sp.]|nr:hypothetical protein [Alistipes sp.]
MANRSFIDRVFSFFVRPGSPVSVPESDTADRDKVATERIEESTGEGYLDYIGARLPLSVAIEEYCGEFATYTEPGREPVKGVKLFLSLCGSTPAGTHTLDLGFDQKEGDHICPGVFSHNGGSATGLLFDAGLVFELSDPQSGKDPEAAVPVISGTVSVRRTGNFHISGDLVLEGNQTVSFAYEGGTLWEDMNA